MYRLFFSHQHVSILRKVFAYCVKHQIHEIEKVDILGLTPSEYTNFAHLQRFGLLYWMTDENGKAIKGGKWGVPVHRIREFLGGTWSVAEYAQKDTNMGLQSVSVKRMYLWEMKDYKEKIQPEEKEWLPDFVSYDADPFDIQNYNDND